jgi:peptide/nickel transport system ATP-binding protein
MAALAAEARQTQTPYGHDALIMCDRLVRIYRGNGIEVQALQGLDLLVDEGELTAVVGASGSGKSTLMNILSGLDTPSAGTVRVAGYDLGALSPGQRLGYRRAVVGFVWQQASRNLLPYLTCRQNVLLPMRLNRLRRAERAEQADQLLDLLNVGHCADRTPDHMSAGEQQRAAIATALANRPHVLLADEPTGDLDTATAAEVLAAIEQVNTQLGVTILVVSHDPAVAAQVRRTVAIRDGRTSTETLLHADTDEGGNSTRRMVEYSVLDRAGRLQLPHEMTRPLGMHGRVRLEAKPDHIGVWPDELRRPATAPADDAAAAPTAAPPAEPSTARPDGSDSSRFAAADTSARTESPLVTVSGVSRSFGHGVAAVRALQDVSVTIPQGQFVVLYGRSGSGKTTLLNIVGGLDAPTSGTVQVAGQDVTAMTERQWASFRRDTVGFVFQSFGLIPILSAAENVGVPLRITGTDRREREDRVRMLLEIVGLDQHAGHRPDELSGGQQQRVASARALAGRPKLLIADEPTGQLDSESGRQIIRLIQTVVASEGITALVATHDPGIIEVADQVLALVDGRLVPGSAAS